MERDIAHRCGHVQRRWVGGYFIADQDREALRLMRKRCDACAATAVRPAVTGHPALPPLAGSPRQVAWAETIRRDRLAALDRVDPAAAARVAGMADARWWIERRGADPRALTFG